MEVVAISRLATLSRETHELLVSSRDLVSICTIAHAD